jgi:hypothetical protein
MLRVVIGGVCLVGGIISIALMLYYFLFMLGSVRSDKKQYLPFLGPFALLLPQLWDEGGNRARARVFLFALLFGACFGGIALAINFLPVPEWSSR